MTRYGLASASDVPLHMADLGFFPLPCRRCVLSELLELSSGCGAFELTSELLVGMISHQITVEVLSRTIIRSGRIALCRGPCIRRKHLDLLK